ncbi:branched-chain amino acid ABC transporter permease [Shimia thalassica]|uniref:branched-chain amino acid ABC transporter permease n=1 Tax=Shimia thalassica TaxID=1715693 RepID=UPI001C092C20|nr:branched-chain amino acid ABC transporter permease [Shimia thalassica]MBU2944373.1 branched-chain amino acid ABC transporter permease [Shimia thalassica]MDO6502282.1 branched-chain amino acid ABC transporter permease [Shimia thalassica]
MRRETFVNIAALAALFVLPIWANAAGETYWVTLTTKVVILAIAGVGLNLALGLGGLVSFGHAAFFGVGGYVMGILASHLQDYVPLLTWPFLFEGSNQMPVIWLVALVFGALTALLIGLLSLRTSGVYFIMITLAFGQMLFYFAISWPAYGGEDGLSIYVRNEFPGLNTLVPIEFYGLCLTVLVAVLFVVWRISLSSFGLALGAARQNAERLQAVGIEPFRIRLTAFVISGAITALAGAMYADLNRFVSPNMFSWQTSGEIMVFVILGGVGRLFGPVLGAALFILMEHILGGMSEFWHIYLGFVLLGVVLFARGGLMGLLAGREVSHD